MRRARIPLWGTVVGVACVALLLYGLSSWVYHRRNTSPEHNPFFQVSNRDYSVFLSQNPDAFRNLPAFGSPGDPSYLEPSLADGYIEAPERALLRYHTWSIYLRDAIPRRPIPASEYLEFLHQRPQWQPNYWAGAPRGYVEVVEVARLNPDWDLSALPLSELPGDPRLAYYGWQNQRHRATLEAYQPTYDEVELLLSQHPEYAREYWALILRDEYPHYLIAFADDDYLPGSPVPNEQMAPFLKQALYNQQLENK